MWQIINDFIGNIISIIGVFLFSKIVLNTSVKVSKSKLVLDVLLSAIAYTLIMINFNGTIKTLSMMCTLFVFNNDLFREKFGKTIFVTFLHTIILLGLDLFVLFSLTEILGVSKSFCYDVVAGSIICNFVVQILTVLTTLCFKNLLRKLVNTEISNNKKIIILSIATIACIAIFFYVFAKEFRINGNSLPYLIVMVVFTIILSSLIKQTIENKKLTNEYDKLLEFMTTYENEIEKQRILRHEIKNEFRTIRAKIIDKQENKEIIEYIDEIVKDKYQIDKEKYAKFGFLPANGIKGLCYFKMQEAEEKGIKVSLNISQRIKESTIYNLSLKEQRDFGKILGVFLDNAIEASIESKGKQLGIEAYANLDKEFKMIISNTYNNEIDKNKIGRESFSTKGKTRGHGLLLVKQLVEKNVSFTMKTDIQKDIYIQTIEIKKL